MIGKYRFHGDDVAADIREKYNFDGDLLNIFANNQGPVVHKWHHYIPLYDQYFSKFRGSNFKFLEIGVSKGGSLQIWREYFGPDATIMGIDIDPDCAQFDGQAGMVRIGSQDDPDFLNKVVDEMGGVDVVLDDGSHVMNHIRTSFHTLFPRLSLPGLYMIEDLHTAYWEDWGGGLDTPGNFFAMVSDLVTDLHGWTHKAPPRVASTNGQVTGVHIHDSIAVIDKGPKHKPTHSRVGSR
ncbi:Demethylmacrocin O-methyltransferase [Tritonibacter multivorans]|uniref:Demethylmacrocin O-methyltransferase n=1 Tax=Tritonibacter multivorans TaxID=928856 RepID=A0A0P1G2D7_9RHOB|nr:class I SAM-dependent methyltransferase [Tritonibacter multivorans]MDA7419680.1 class I SAM-dependent methyltransferase [Tritonibacter multivorans]CUH75965.1 Demethylmacrocin O-methyltransferase [Tritonibacter multivorans]SFC57919.1 hypothetical protein SAMN04488049_103137 [Tritonibacter multivorans]